MHDEIIRYSMEGQISDADVVTNKERLIFFLEEEMRSQGVAPTLDMDPQFTLDYDREAEVFNFALSVYGSYVGSEKACEVAGTMFGKTIMMSTPQTKSKESSGM